MLWEVMDKDTDILTKELTKAMLKLKRDIDSPLGDTTSDIVLLVSKARPLCKWYLTSAALTVYGLPIYISQTWLFIYAKLVFCLQLL